MKRLATPLLVLLACSALVWPGCSRQHSENAFLPSSPDFSNALMVTVAASSIPADGFSRVEITAQITGDADLDKRQVKYTTDNGDFPRESAAGTKTTTVNVDSKGEATVELRSGKSPALATITVQVLDKGTSAAIDGLITRVTVEFIDPEAGAIIQLSSSPERGEADASSVVFVHADVGEGIPGPTRPVVFVTTLGTFVGGMAGTAPNTHTVTINADLDRRATATLKSPATAGEALVTASVADTTAEIRIPFDPALPEVIVVNLGAAKLDRGGTEETTITVLLSRNEGKVTTGTAIAYSAFDKESGRPLDLIFRDQTLSDANEQATAKVALGNVSFVGTATIRAQVGNVRGEADIEIDAVGPAPDVAVTPGNLAFGTVSVGMNKDLALTIKNEGDAELLVTWLRTHNGDFSIPALPALPMEVAPGASFDITIRFSPAHTGTQSGSLRITSNDPDKEVLSVSLTGEGI